MKIITIGREFGSGGRELAKRLSEELKIAYYDKEIITWIAEKGGLNEQYVKETLEHDLMANYAVTIGRSFMQISSETSRMNNLLVAQRQVLLDIAEKGEDCIIVGRSADTVLSEYHPLRIFVYADQKAKIKRCMERENGNSEKEIIQMMKRIDKARASYYGLFSDAVWGSKDNYDLCINTTKLQIKKLIPSLAEYLKSLV